MFKILILLNKFVTLLIHKYILNHGLHRNSTFHMFFYNSAKKPDGRIRSTRHFLYYLIQSLYCSRNFFNPSFSL